MTLREQILADASAVFCNTSDFAESVTYHPHQFWGEAARASRVINAVVIREQLTTFSEDGDVVLPVYQVHVANDATLGIASDEVDLGGDQIELPPRDGKASERKSITQLMIQDNGMIVIECR